MDVVIWGIPKDHKFEEILYTKSQCVDDAKKVCKILEKKHGCSNTRIQVIDMSSSNDIINAFKGGIIAK